MLKFSAKNLVEVSYIRFYESPYGDFCALLLLFLDYSLFINKKSLKEVLFLSRIATNFSDFIREKFLKLSCVFNRLL
ncbi:MAG: hypothetical protein LBT04_03235, partial [Prevotellaceae bacterium]|nr:hypothetical protein [Prevotellaceae bacterium]